MAVTTADFSVAGQHVGMFTGATAGTEVTLDPDREYTFTFTGCEADGLQEAASAMMAIGISSMPAVANYNPETTPDKVTIGGAVGYMTSVVLGPGLEMAYVLSNEETGIVAVIGGPKLQGDF